MLEKRLAKVVLDTNVFISGLILPKSIPSRILDLWRENKFILVTSPKILQELNKALHYPKILRFYKIKEKTIKDLIGSIAKTSIVVFDEKIVEVIKEDPDDNKFETDFVIMMKEGSNELKIEHDHHTVGIFSKNTWIELFENAGFKAEVVPINHNELESGSYNGILGVKARNL